MNEKQATLSITKSHYFHYYFSPVYFHLNCYANFSERSNFKIKPCPYHELVNIYIQVLVFLNYFYNFNQYMFVSIHAHTE